MYRLHGFCQSGHTYRIAFMLEALKQPWEPVFVDYLAGATQDAEWRRNVNEMGEVPVLEDGQRRLSQSGVILSYLARKHGAFEGDTEDDRLEVLRWILFDNHKFTSCFASYRYLKSFVSAEPDPGVMRWLYGRMDSAFGIVDKHLSNRSFLVGTNPTIADISLCGYLFYPDDESGYQVAKKYRHIAKWLENIRQIPGWSPPYDIFPGR